MKKICKLAVTLALLFIILVFFNTGSVLANDPSSESGDKIVIGDSYYLPKGKTLDGRLIVFVGSVVLEEGSSVTGDVILTSSNLVASGNIMGNIISVGGGQVSIKETAKISGDVITVASVLERADGAVIRGDIVGANPTLIPSSIRESVMSGFHDLWNGLNPLWNFVGDIFSALILSGLGALVVLLIPEPTKKVGKTIQKNVLLSGVFGLLTIIVYPFAILICVVTLILIPVVPVLLLATLFILIWGWIVIGYELGQKIIQQFHWNWADPLVAAFGVFILTFVVNALSWLNSCCLETPVLIIVLSVGLGSILLSRFGTQAYVNVKDNK